MKLWIKILLWILLWVPLSLFSPTNIHFPVAFFAPYWGFASVWDPDAWHGGLFFEITLPWIAFWSVLTAIIDIHLANHEDGPRLGRFTKRQTFWFGLIVFFGVMSLLVNRP